MTTIACKKTRFLSVLFALVFLAAPGCVGGPSTQDTTVGSVPPPMPRPVSADQIDSQNARAMPQALRDEMARENQ